MAALWATLGHSLVNANEIAAGQNIIATMPQSDVSPSVVCLSVFLPASSIKRTLEHAREHPSNHHPITESPNRSAVMLTTPLATEQKQQFSN